MTTTACTRWPSVMSGVKCGCSMLKWSEDIEGLSIIHGGTVKQRGSKDETSPRRHGGHGGLGWRHDGKAFHGRRLLFRCPGESRTPLSAAHMADGWVPAFPTDQVRGLKAHGTT